MKKLKFWLIPLLIILLALILVMVCFGGKSDIDTKDYSRNIVVEALNGSAVISHTDKSTEDAAVGTALRSDDGVSTGAGSDLLLDADGKQQMYVQENSKVQLQASGTPENGKTRLHLQQGGVLSTLKASIKEGELYEVKTNAGTVSVSEGTFRVDAFQVDGQDYMLVEVYDGEATVKLDGAKTTTSVKAGEAVLVRIPEKGNPTFVLSDEVDEAFWNAPGWEGLTVGKDGVGTAILPIPYAKLPAGVLDQLIALGQSGVTLPVSVETLTNLKEFGHDYTCTVVAEPTCVEEGVMRLECGLCGDVKEEPVEALGHTPEAMPEEEGKTGGERCAVCQEILVPQETIAVEEEVPQETTAVEETVSQETVAEETTADAVCEHVAEVLPAKAPTCNEEGLTEGSRCANCGEILVEQEVVPVSAHVPEVLAAKAPTCDEEGLTEGSRCVECGEIITEQEVLPTIDHAVELVPGKEATCTETGLTEGSVCSVCLAVLIAQEEIPEIPHTPETVPGKDPTCAETGLTEGSRCVVCGKVLVEQELIPCKEHTPLTIRGKYTTCFRAGWTESVVCSECGEVLVPSETIPMLEHTPGSLSSYPATENSEGRTFGMECRICGYPILAQKVIPKLGSQTE